MYCAEIKIVYEIITALGHMNLAEGFGFFPPLKRQHLNKSFQLQSWQLTFSHMHYFFLPAIRGSADQYIKLS